MSAAFDAHVRALTNIARAGQLPMGCVVKVLVGYRSAWWRAAGLSGQSVCDGGPVVATYDDCTPDDAHHALVAFINGREAQRWAAEPAAARRTAVLHQLAYLFGSQEALTPLSYHETDWTAEQYSRGKPCTPTRPCCATNLTTSSFLSAGCYVGYAPPGVLTGYEH